MACTGRRCRRSRPLSSSVVIVVVRFRCRCHPLSGSLGDEISCVVGPLSDVVVGARRRRWWALVDVQAGWCAAVCVRRLALLHTRGGGAAIVNGRGRSLTVVVGPRLRSTRLVGCCVRSSTGAAGYAWWWGGHSTWAWTLVDSGGGASLAFNKAGGLPSASVDGRCRIRVVVGRP